MSNAKKIWDMLIAAGMTEAGAAGSLGNMQAESGLEPCRMQGDFSQGYLYSKMYAAEVDSGKVSRESFITEQSGGGGWGLCQWTYWSYKASLYDLCKSLGVSIGDLTAQVKFYISEVKNRKPAVWAVLTTTSSVREASDIVMLKYERPANQSEEKQQLRANYAQAWFDKLSGKGSDQLAEEEEKTMTRSMLRLGSKGADVSYLQASLNKLGYNCGAADGDYGIKTATAVRVFQRAYGLYADGVVGEKTWAELEKALKGKPTGENTAISAAVKRLIATAKGEVGYLEKASNSQLEHMTANAGFNNWNKYARDIDTKCPNFYNGKKNGYAWCDCFVDWCFIETFGLEVGQKLLCQPDKSSGAGCTESARYYTNKGQLFYSDPQPGDQIFFGADGYYGHTGIVVAVDSNTIYTVEGNTSGAAGVIANGGGVFEKAYSKSGSYAFGRPDYSIVDEVPTEPDVEEEPPKDEPVKEDVTAETGGDAEVKVSVLKKGMTGAQVKSAQLLLIGNGYSCGGAGADGDFGAGTYGAVLKYQSKHNLGEDGIIGPATWKALLGVS